jgi:hypothetical protein
LTLEVCPACGQPRRAQKGEGARAALQWKKLPRQNFGLLQYLEQRFKGAPFDETVILTLKEFKIDPRPLGGRISELRAWNLILDHKVKGKPMAYKLNLQRARQVLDAGGDLARLPRPKPGFDDQAIINDKAPGPIEGFTGYRKQSLGEGNDV